MSPGNVAWEISVIKKQICKGTRKPNLGGRRAGRLHTRQETRNLGLKAITDKSGPVPIRFEVNDRETLMPLGDHAAHWANYLGELVRELPLHYPSWRQMPPERKAGVVAKIGIYNGKKAALKERYWVPEEYGTYDLERLRRGRPSYISEVDWDAQLAFWNDPKNLARDAQNKQNRAKSKVKAALMERHGVFDEDGTYDMERIRRGHPSHIFKVDWDAQIAFWNDPKNLSWAAQNKQNR
ncbi:hypothetical protein Tco_0193829, partial [Tanacetum coccineum]